MHPTATARKTTCFDASGRASAQMLISPSDESIATAKRMGQLVPIASCCQSLFNRINQRWKGG